MAESTCGNLVWHLEKKMFSFSQMSLKLISLNTNNHQLLILDLHSFLDLVFNGEGKKRKDYSTCWWNNNEETERKKNWGYSISIGNVYKKLWRKQYNKKQTKWANFQKQLCFDYEMYYHFLHSLMISATISFQVINVPSADFLSLGNL